MLQAPLSDSVAVVEFECNPDLALSLKRVLVEQPVFVEQRKGERKSTHKSIP